MLLDVLITKKPKHLNVHALMAQSSLRRVVEEDEEEVEEAEEAEEVRTASGMGTRMVTTMRVKVMIIMVDEEEVEEDEEEVEEAEESEETDVDVQ